MKTNYLQTLLAPVMALGLILSTAAAPAQESTATYSTQPSETPAPAPAPRLAYGVSQIVQLAQANIGDDTIIAYIKNSGNSYGLNADQIIYLRQQGVSAPVITTMLAQPKPGILAPAPANTASQPVVITSDPEPTYVYQPAVSSVMIGPSITAIDPTAAARANSSYYYQSYCYPTYYSPYYPSYGCYYPRISIGWRGGNGWHGNGFHGGFHGGWHR